MSGEYRDATEALAELVGGPIGRSLPQGPREAAVPLLVDAVGVALAGLGTETGRILQRYATSFSGTEGLVGDTTDVGAPTCSAELFALLYGALGHSLDFDDAFPGVGHHSVILTSSVLATMPYMPSRPSGRELLDAFVVGFEVSYRVAQLLDQGHTRSGWHMTSTAGVFGACAAASRLFKLSPQVVRAAFGICGSLVAGLTRNFGTTVKPLHSGISARSGVMAAELASLGATADPSIMDGRAGVIEIYGGRPPDLAQFDDLGNTFAIESPGPSLKAYPCCYSAARAIDAVLSLKDSYNVDHSFVESIHCSVPVGLMRSMPYPTPETELEAKFSMEYVVSSALIDGGVGLSSFSPHALSREDVRSLMRRVYVVEESRMRPEDPSGRTSSAATGGKVQVSIQASGLEPVSATVVDPKGSPANPMSDRERRAKFIECARYGGLGKTEAEELFSDLSVLPVDTKSISTLEMVRAQTFAALSKRRMDLS